MPRPSCPPVWRPHKLSESDSSGLKDYGFPSTHGRFCKLVLLCLRSCVYVRGYAFKTNTCFSDECGEQRPCDLVFTLPENALVRASIVCRGHLDALHWCWCVHVWSCWTLCTRVDPHSCLPGRLYLGVHTVTDVVGGSAIGLALFILHNVLHDTLQATRGSTGTVAACAVVAMALLHKLRAREPSTPSYFQNSTCVGTYVTLTLTAPVTQPHKRTHTHTHDAHDAHAHKHTQMCPP